tara:strand:+ start:1678 stop:1962 length:285 start_codon:yes stop_codon:yes gene_type:complete
MLTEITIIYPHKSNRKSLVDLIQKQKDYFLNSSNCKEFRIFEDTYSEKIFTISKWSSKDDLKEAIDVKEHRKHLEKIVNLQKFPAEVYRLEDID